MSGYSDIIVNISLLFIVAIYIICSELVNEEWICIFFLIFQYFYIDFVLKGYGNITMVAIAELTIVNICMDSAAYIVSDSTLYLIFSLFCNAICIIFAMIIIYVRLRMEDILDIEFVDNMLYAIFNTNFAQSMKSITDNDWFKGIGIAVISGTILEKNKERKERQKEKNDIE